MPTSIQSAFRAIASWAASVEQATNQNTIEKRPTIIKDNQTSGVPLARLGSSIGTAGVGVSTIEQPVSEGAEVGRVLCLLQCFNPGLYSTGRNTEGASRAQDHCRRHRLGCHAADAGHDDDGRR